MANVAYTGIAMFGAVMALYCVEGIALHDSMIRKRPLYSVLQACVMMQKSVEVYTMLYNGFSGMPLVYSGRLNPTEIGLFSPTFRQVIGAILKNFPKKCMGVIFELQNFSFKKSSKKFWGKFWPESWANVSHFFSQR